MAIEGIIDFYEFSIAYRSERIYNQPGMPPPRGKLLLGKERGIPEESAHLSCRC